MMKALYSPIGIALCALTFSAQVVCDKVLAKPAVDGIERINKKEEFTTAAEDALVVFSYKHQSSYSGGFETLPVMIWARRNFEKDQLEPYPKKSTRRPASLTPVPMGQNRFMRKAGAYAKKGTFFYGFRIPKGAHVLCELYVSPPGSSVYETINLELNALYFDFTAGAVNFIGDYIVKTKKSVREREKGGDTIISITDTGIEYLAENPSYKGIADSDKQAAVKIFLEKYHPNINADIVIAKPTYVDLTQKADTPSGYAEVADASKPPEDTLKIARILRSKGEFDPKCLPIK